MIGMLDPHRRRPHDAYHRFLRAGAWSLEDLWRLLAEKLGVLPASVREAA
jgi:hypothetical protein